MEPNRAAYLALLAKALALTFELSTLRAVLIAHGIIPDVDPETSAAERAAWFAELSAGVSQIEGAASEETAELIALVEAERATVHTLSRSIVAGSRKGPPPPPK